LPELPEVETVRRGLNQVTGHYKIQGGDVLLDRTIAYPVFIRDFWAGLQGCAIAQWHRRGKYLLAELLQAKAPAGWLGVHLRMTGQLLWLSSAEPLHKHTRVRFYFDNEHELRFVDQRTFGQIWWVPPQQAPETVITGLQRLGPEPFSCEFSVGYLTQQLQGRHRSIKSALLDQSLVAGVGNIYADEALFLSQIRPDTPCNRLNPLQIQRLQAAVVNVLQTSIARGGTTFSNFLNVQGVNGNYGGEAWVYDREKEPCRHCATPVERVKLAGRSTHFCPHCQI
jgi:formamidopyrimidine-DNA glycosylase